MRLKGGTRWTICSPDASPDPTGTRKGPAPFYGSRPFQSFAAYAAALRTTSATLTSTLSTNRSFPLTLPLGAGLFVVPPLAELRIETGPLHLALEPAQCAVEALVVLNDDFQENHLPTG